jgi:hypothetical protein
MQLLNWHVNTNLLFSLQKSEKQTYKVNMKQRDNDRFLLWSLWE